MNGVKNILKGLKNVIFKIFGKARWWFVIFVVTAILVIVSTSRGSIYPYTRGITDANGSFVSLFSPDYIEGFSVNQEGLAVIVTDQTLNGTASVLQINTNEQICATISNVTVDISTDDYFYPHDMAITDEGIIYAIRSDFDENAICLKDTIVKLSKEYRYLGEVCSFDYDASDRNRGLTLSGLHYYNGEITFASVDRSGVYLYSIDTKSQALTKSDFYSTDEDGTYTACVIPMDGSFMFLRSDGQAYQVAFNESFKESIYQFELQANEATTRPYFNIATIVNGDLYVAQRQNPDGIYTLKDGKVTKAIDLSLVAEDKCSPIVSMDSYRMAGSDSDALIICLKDGIFTYADGSLQERQLQISFHPTALMVLNAVVIRLMMISIYALIINLIIRKKTLLYKHLVLLLPVFITLTALVAVKIYIYSDEQIAQNMDDQMRIICELGRNSFEDYDFSKLLHSNENTGAAYQEICEKLEQLGASQDWSRTYIFSIVYRNDKEELITLCGDDDVYMPLYYRELAKFTDAPDSKEDVFISNEVSSLWTDSHRDSMISGYGRIHDIDASGRYYLKVSTDNGALFLQRRAILFKVFLYGFMIISVMTLLIVMLTAGNLRVIKKATKTVKEISEGNLSSRINYRSKDELGEICSEVNEMGQSLERLFKEKDATEKFYYKFVPEKFRELLGKEKFTDLALGDAKSSELTVLFCDIRSFSINSEMMTAKENFSFVNVIYGKMGPIVRKNNGFVDKYIGDAVMALFENPGDAVRCGIELYQAIVLDPQTAKELHISDINIGIGVHTGMSMIGIVGEEERLAGTVISDTVNLSSRLESLTKQYKTAMLVSKDTIDRIQDPESLNLRYLGIVQVAGVNEVKAIYEVLDCLTEEGRKERMANQEAFREAIRLFHLGRRSEAAEALQDIANAGTNDYVTDLYLDYIKQMSEEDKANVFRFVRK